jgi:hypothetical protein
VHVADERRIRLAGVFEIAVAALSKRTVIEMVSGQQHGADSVDETAHSLGAQTARIHLATHVQGHHGLGDPRLVAGAVDLDKACRD